MMQSDLYLLYSYICLQAWARSNDQTQSIQPWGLLGWGSCCIFFFERKISKFYSTSKSISEALCSGQTLEQLMPFPASFPGCLHTRASITVTLPHFRIICSEIRLRNTFLNEGWVLMPNSEPGPFHSWGLSEHRGEWPLSSHYRRNRWTGGCDYCHPSCMNILNNVLVMKTLGTPRGFGKPDPCSL